MTYPCETCYIYIYIYNMLYTCIVAGCLYSSRHALGREPGGWAPEAGGTDGPDPGEPGGLHCRTHYFKKISNNPVDKPSQGKTRFLVPKPGKSDTLGSLPARIKSDCYNMLPRAGASAHQR